MTDLNWMTGGKQGSGIDSALELFARIMMKCGYYVFGYREYFSNIKGMHSFFTLRVSDKKVRALSSKVDLAVFFDKEAVFGEKNNFGEVVHEGHLKDLRPSGTLVIDSKIDANGIQRKDINVIQFDFDTVINAVAKKFNKPASDVMITKNVMAVAISAHLLGLSEQKVTDIISDVFSHKPQQIIDMNIAVANQTMESMDALNIKKVSSLPILDKKELLYTEGFAASAIGKALAGCKMQVYYPITPASDESEFIESHPELGIRVVQPESELAVICMTTGAAIAGIRASTSTSGPGLSLMTEAITYAGMCEVPIVVVDHQRGAPATGQPTRTEQGDLMFAAHIGHGDFGHMILAPGNIEEYISTVSMAFNYAEKYQMPVIVLGEKAVAQASTTLEASFVRDLKSKYKVDRGKLIQSPGSDYKRFRFTDDNISPRVQMGDPSTIVWYTGDEHDERGHISEEPNIRNRMMEKRNFKYEKILTEVPPDERFTIFGDLKKADLVAVSWGGPSGAISESLSDKIAFVQIKMLNPLPLDALELIKKSKKTVCIEQNISGQLRQHIASQTGLVIANQILKYNGRPMRKEEVSDAFSRVLKGETKVILNDY